MKNTFLALAILTLFGIIFFAAAAATAPSDLQTVKGTIQSLSIGNDPMAGNKSELVIVDGGGQQLRFTVRTGIGITVSGRERLATLKSLGPGDTVIIDYIKNRDGTNKVMTIEIYSYQKR